MRSVNRTLASVPTLTSASGSQDGFKAEYEEKCLAFLSVQRNYETMSRMMQLKQQELDQVKQLYECESTKAVSLGVQLEDALSRAAKAEANNAKLSGMQEAYTALQAEHARLKYEASLSAGKATAASDKLASFQKATEDAEFKASTIERERDAWRSTEEGHKSEQERLRRELEAVRAEARALGTDLQNTRHTVLKAQECTQVAERHAATLNAQLATRDEQVAALQDNIRSLQDALREAQSSVRASEVALSTCRHQQSVADASSRSLGRALELAGEERRLAVARATRLEEKVNTAHESLALCEQRMASLTTLLAESEDKYQASLVQGTEAGEGLTRLQVQLASNKAMLADTRRQMAEAERMHISALQAAQAAAAGAEARLAEQVARSARTRHQYMEFMQALVVRVEKSIIAATAFQSKFGASITEAAERQQKGLAALGYRLQVWEAQAGDVGERVTHLGAMIRQMASELTSFKLTQASGAADQASAQRLQDRVAVLEGLLAAEQAAKAAAVQSKARAEEAHTEALTALRVRADERVDAERQRLGVRLAQVEAEVVRLRITCEEDRAAAARVLELERSQMLRTVQAAADRESELMRELAALEDRAVNGSRHELATLNRRFVDETLATKNRHEAELAQLQNTIVRLRSSLSSGQATCQQVLAEMGVVMGHLAKMGWEIHLVEPGAANELCRSPDEDGTHLVKLVGLTRLHFAYITEAVQNMARKPLHTAPPPVLTPQPQGDWNAMAKDLRATVAQLLHVEESLAPNCTCMLCLDVLKQPATCVPCGHTYCKSCLDDHGQLCVECGDRPVPRVVFSPALEAICAKYEYKLTALQSLNKSMQAVS